MARRSLPHYPRDTEDMYRAHLSWNSPWIGALWGTTPRERAMLSSLAEQCKAAQHMTGHAKSRELKSRVRHRLSKLSRMMRDRFQTALVAHGLL